MGSFLYIMIIDDPLVEKDRKNPFVNDALKWLEFQLGKGEGRNSYQVQPIPPHISYRKVGNWDITGTYTNHGTSIPQVGIENLTINFIMIPIMKDTHLSPTFAFQSYILVGILTRCDQFILTPVSVISETTRL